MLLRALFLFLTFSSLKVSAQTSPPPEGEIAWKSPYSGAGSLPSKKIITPTFFFGQEGFSFTQCPKNTEEWKSWREATLQFFLSIPYLENKKYENLLSAIDVCEGGDGAKKNPALHSCLGDFKTYLNNRISSTQLPSEYFNSKENVEHTTMPTELSENDGQMLKDLATDEGYQKAFKSIESANLTRAEKQKWKITRYRVINIPGQAALNAFMVTISVPGNAALGIPDKYIRVSTEAPKEFKARYPKEAAIKYENNVCMITSLKVSDPSKNGGFSYVSNIGDFDLKEDPVKGTETHLVRRYESDHGSKQNCADCHHNDGPIFINPDPLYFEGVDGKPFSNQKEYFETLDSIKKRMESAGPAKFGNQLYKKGEGPKIGNDQMPLSDEQIKKCVGTAWSNPKLQLTQDESVKLRKRLIDGMKCTACHNDADRSILREGPYEGTFTTWNLIENLTTGRRDDSHPENLAQRHLMPPYPLMGNDVEFPLDPKSSNRNTQLEIVLRQALPECLKLQSEVNYHVPSEKLGYAPYGFLKPEFYPLMHLTKTSCDAKNESETNSTANSSDLNPKSTAPAK